MQLQNCLELVLVQPMVKHAFDNPKSSLELAYPELAGNARAEGQGILCFNKLTQELLLLCLLLLDQHLVQRQATLLDKVHVGAVLFMTLARKVSASTLDRL